MAKAEDDQDGGNKEVEKLERAIKTNRTLFFVLLACSAVIISILITSVLVINIQLSNRREVPTEEFAELLEEMDSHLQHLAAIHNSEAQVYFEFEDALGEIKTLYQHNNINTLRQLLIEREKDTRKLLELMGEGTASLANMAPGSREWTQHYREKLAREKQQSEQRQTSLTEAMKPEEEEVEDVDA